MQSNLTIRTQEEFDALVAEVIDLTNSTTKQYNYDGEQYYHFPDDLIIEGTPDAPINIISKNRMQFNNTQFKYCTFGNILIRLNKCELNYCYKTVSAAMYIYYSKLSNCIFTNSGTHYFSSSVNCLFTSGSFNRCNIKNCYIKTSYFKVGTEVFNSAILALSTSTNTVFLFDTTFTNCFITMYYALNNCKTKNCFVIETNKAIEDSE